MLSLFSASPSLTVGVAPVTAPRAAASMAASSLSFTKYHGLGNDFVLLDCRDMAEPPLTPTQAASMCDRNFGVGADGVIFVLPPDTEDARVRMRIYNSDGSEPEMCGNGIRCMAKYFSAELESLAVGESDQYTISTLAGPIIPEILANGEIKVDMGEPILEGKLVPTTLPSDDDGRVVLAPMSVGGKDWEVTCVSMGNPHAVVFVDDLDALDFDTVGPLFEVDAASVPAEDPGPSPDPSPRPSPNPDPSPGLRPDPSPGPHPDPNLRPSPSPNPSPKPNPAPNPNPSPDPHQVDAAFPAKTNTEFVQVLSPTHLKMKVWERGAGPTLACGTGVAARRRGRQPSPGLSASRHSGHRRRPSRLPPCRPAAPAASPPRHLATFARRRVCADRGRGARGQGGEDVHGHAAGRRPADRVARERQPHLHDRPGRAHLPRRV